ALRSFGRISQLLFGWQRACGVSRLRIIGIARPRPSDEQSLDRSLAPARSRSPTASVDLPTKNGDDLSMSEGSPGLVAPVSLSSAPEPVQPGSRGSAHREA